MHQEIVRIWRPGVENLLQTLVGQRGKVHTLAFSPDGKLLLASGASKTINLYERV